MMDIAIPNNNEKEFVEVALRLGIKKLHFLYDFDNSQKINEKLGKLNSNKINIQIGFVVNQKNINMALQHSKLLVAKSSDKDRFFIEGKKIKIIYGFEGIHKKDYLHQRASGLNHVLCELASGNSITIGFSYSSLLGKNPAETSLAMGRMAQNISLCRKYSVKTIIGSFSQNPFELRSAYDIASLFTILGMDSKKIKDSLNFNL